LDLLTQLAGGSEIEVRAAYALSYFEIAAQNGSWPASRSPRWSAGSPQELAGEAQIRDRHPRRAAAEVLRIWRALAQLGGATIDPSRGWIPLAPGGRPEHGATSGLAR
jgi:hypothetical protein